MKWNLHPKANDFKAVHTRVEDAMLQGEQVVRITKKDKIPDADENTYAELKNIQLKDGTIEMRLYSRLLPDAPEHARGFVGIVYRAKKDSSEFESFYVRPTNGRNCQDPIRRSHGCQYFSYPGYTFQYFREFGITDFEAPTELALEEWFTIRAEIHGETAAFYINDEKEPVLSVTEMKHGAGIQGAIGIFVDIGTEAFVSKIRIVSQKENEKV